MNAPTYEEVQSARRRFIGQYVAHFLAAQATVELERRMNQGLHAEVHPPVEDAIYQAEEAWIALLDQNPRNAEFWLP